MITRTVGPRECVQWEVERVYVDGTLTVERDGVGMEERGVTEGHSPTKKEGQSSSLIGLKK